MNEKDIFELQSKIAKNIVALKEERDLKVKLYERYIEDLKLLYNKEIEKLENLYSLCHKN